MEALSGGNIDRITAGGVPCGIAVHRSGIFRVHHIATLLLHEGESMDITEVRVFPVNNEERLKAYATITVDNVFLIRDLRVINGNAGLFVAMPSRKMKDGTFKDIAHPLNSETRQMIEKKVLAEYESELVNPTQREQAPKVSEER
jgi:stage V sporulation protein G